MRLFSAPLVDAHGRRAAPAGRSTTAKRRRRAAVDRALPRACRALRRHRGAGDPLPAAPRSEPGVSHRRARVSSRRPALRSSEPAANRELTALDEQLHAAFGTLGTTEQARYLASLYVDDLADVWRDGIDPRFELARYGERLAASAASFDPLHEALTGEPTLVDATLDELTRELLAAHEPDVVAITAPFPGNVYGAFRMARTIRAAAPKATLMLGGGWVNTELRSLRDPRVFDYFDYVTLDDGERPLLNLLTRLRGQRRAAGAHLRAQGDEVVLETDRDAARHPAARHGHPDLRRPAARRNTCPSWKC